MQPKTISENFGLSSDFLQTYLKAGLEGAGTKSFLTFLAHLEPDCKKIFNLKINVY